MRGIPEERLKELFHEHCSTGLISEERLRSECKELAPWIPIDENIPKEKDLLLINKSKRKYIGMLFKSGIWCINGAIDFMPTQYQELPPDPED